MLSLPLSESLVAFNDPEREMRGRREALDEAREILRTIDTPASPELWRNVQKLKGRASRQSWPFFEALDEFIPWDLAFSKHYRVRLRIPYHALAEAKQLWPRERIVFVVWSAVEWSGKRTPVTYHALDRGRLLRGEFSLPAIIFAISHLRLLRREVLGNPSATGPSNCRSPWDFVTSRRAVPPSFKSRAVTVRFWVRCLVTEKPGCDTALPPRPQAHHQQH